MNYSKALFSILKVHALWIILKLLPPVASAFYSALRMAKALGFYLLHSVFSLYCVDCWSFCGPGNNISSLRVPYWLLWLCPVVLESFFPHFSKSNSESLTGSYGCVQWLQSLPPRPPYSTAMERGHLCEDQNSPMVSFSHCSIYAAYDTYYEWVGTEDRAQWDTELESFPLPRPLSPQTQNRKHGYVAISIFNFSS